MTIKEVEDRTGLTRSNIRFYEKEKLIEPSRNDKNGYRDYSEKDVENIIKIAYLRTLEISIEDIRNIVSDKVPLAEMIKKQTTAIQTQKSCVKECWNLEISVLTNYRLRSMWQIWIFIGAIINLFSNWIQLASCISGAALLHG